MDDIDLTKDPKWVRRMLSYFDANDRDHDGVITVEQVGEWAECLREPCQASEENMSKVKNQLRESYKQANFTSEGMKREDYPKQFSDFCRKERERKRKNQPTVHGQLVSALFDVIDCDHDNHINLKEMKLRMKAMGMPEEVAKSYLELADTNKNGTVERNELIDIEFRFWFEPIDDSLDNLYGGIFSGNV